MELLTSEETDVNSKDRVARSGDVKHEEPEGTISKVVVVNCHKDEGWTLVKSRHSK